MTAATIEDVFVKIAEGDHDVHAEDATRASLIAPRASRVDIRDPHSHGDGLGTGSTERQSWPLRF
jgi:hypothetical protein